MDDSYETLKLTTPRAHVLMVTLSRPSRSRNVASRGCKYGRLKRSLSGLHGDCAARALPLNSVPDVLAAFRSVANMVTYVPCVRRRSANEHGAWRVDTA